MEVIPIPSANVTEERLEQLWKTFVPMDTTLAGMVIEDSEVQS